MAERASSVGATTGSSLTAMLAIVCITVSACGQKGALIAARSAPALSAASSPDKLPIPGISPADLPAPVPQR